VVLVGTIGRRDPRPGVHDQHLVAPESLGNISSAFTASSFLASCVCDRRDSRSFVLEWAYLDRVGPGGRVGGGELDRLFLVGAADHVDRGDVLAGGEERAVGQQDFPLADAERGDGVGSREGSSQDVQAAGGCLLPPGVSLG
jgi:hypothetical protein